MLQPADLLMLDEPTNDLDIPALEVLEASLAEFPGALVIVSHDRELLDGLCTEVIGLDGKGGAALYGNVDQWLTALERDAEAARKPARPAPRPAPPPPAAKPRPEQLRAEGTRQDRVGHRPGGGGVGAAQGRRAGGGDGGARRLVGGVPAPGGVAARGGQAVRAVAGVGEARRGVAGLFGGGLFRSFLARSHSEGTGGKYAGGHRPLAGRRARKDQHTQRTWLRPPRR